jgi:hypothetical protein
MSKPRETHQNFNVIRAGKAGRFVLLYDSATFLTLVGDNLSDIRR